MKKRSGMSVWHAITVTTLATAMLLASSVALLATTADAAEKPKKGGKLTVHLNRGISGFDPIKSPRGGLGRTQVLWAIHEKLFRFDPKTGKLVPGLATEKSHNDDFTVWRVKLREGVKFSNGEPLTTEAYVHHFDRLLGSKLAKRYRRNLMAPVERVVAIDELTMEFQFSAPAPAFDYAMASSNAWVWFLNAPGFAKKNENDPNYNGMAVGAGPYMLKEWIPSESVTLVRNPHYWNPDAQHLDEITYRVIPGPESTPYMAFLAGDLDAFGTVGEAISKARRDSKKRGFTVIEGYRETSAWVLNFNLSKPPIDDIRVRTALVQAVNREAIAQIITRGAGRVGDQVYPPESPWHCPDVKYPPYNPEKAKALLKEYGKPVTFTLVTLNNAKFRRGAEILQEMWAKVGVKVDLQVMSRGAVGFEKGLFEGTFHAWVQAGINLLHPLMGEIDLHSKDKGNIRRANSPKLDSAIDALKASALKGEKALYEANCELEKAKAEILPYMNVYYTLNGVFLHKHVKGVPYPTEGMKYFHEAWIDR